MSVQLLDKTRKINYLLHHNHSRIVIFNDICEVMSSVLESHTVVISKKGKVLGMKSRQDIESDTVLIQEAVGDFIEPTLNDRMLNVLSTNENANLLTLGFNKQDAAGYHALITPIDIAGERLGTLFIYKKDAPYQIDDIILCEYGATVVSLEMLRAFHEENEEESRRLAVVQSAIRTLSVSETEAIRHVLREIHHCEGMIVASKIADKAGISRSSIVNALRKFESAGVIESKSAGVKGTYVRVLNELVDAELNNK